MLGSSSAEAQQTMYALVGEYLHLWSYMESRMNAAIEKALDLGSVQGAIVCCNINFYSKCHILKTSLEFQGLGCKSHDEHAAIMKRLSELQNLAPERNMIAHESFFPSDDLSSVKFYVFKAKGKFSMPSTFWTQKDFEAKFARITEFTDLLDDIGSRIIRGRIAKVLAENSATKQELNALAQLTLHAPQPQADRTLDTPDATGQTDPQTPAGPHRSK